MLENKLRKRSGLIYYIRIRRPLVLKNAYISKYFQKHMLHLANSLQYLARISILLFLIITGFTFPADAQVSDSVIQTTTAKTGFIGISAVMYITTPNPEKLLLDSLVWRQQKILRHSYNGKKVKQMLYQKSTDRFIVFLGGNKALEMNKATAIQEGFLAHEPEKKPATKSSFHSNYIQDIYPDSPLYIGIQNYVILRLIDNNDIISSYPGVDIAPEGTSDKYLIVVNTPGRIEVDINDGVSKTIKYRYHFLVKRMPADDLEIIPDVQLGNIKTLAVKKQLLTEQNEMTVSNNYSFVSATVYFSGPAFRDIITTTADSKLTYVKCYMDLCTPGCNIVFDNVMIKDKTGKLFNTPAFSLRVTEDAVADSTPVDYFSQSSGPEFPGGNDLLELIVNQELSKAKSASITPGKYNVSFVIKVGANGEISAPCANELARMTAIEKKCFDIIKAGALWKPGMFKNINTPMAVGISLKVEIK